ncbi:MAG: hydroxyacid dehydrogenase [Planctomycetaceae bacterium]|nr:hydroxyacid dehydrogenase [Planctomycetaceae bacterium]
MSWLAQPRPDWVTTKMQALDCDFVERDCQTSDQAMKLAADADIIWVMGGWTGITADMLPSFKNCGAIIRSGSGTDNIPVDAASELGIMVCNTPGATAIPVAEHAVALMLAVAREIPKWNQAVKNGQWNLDHPTPVRRMNTATAGLIGFGAIARNVALRLAPFNMNIIAHDPVVDPDLMRSLNVEPVTLEQLYAQSDYISIHCPLLDSTHHLIDEAALRRMKSTAVLVNTARGPIVDTQALAKALTEGWIWGAGIDVLETEPADPNDPLLKLDNAILTAHVAGYHATMFDTFWNLSIEIVADLIAGRQPVSVVNAHLKPRWSLTPR